MPALAPEARMIMFGLFEAEAKARPVLDAEDPNIVIAFSAAVKALVACMMLVAPVVK